LIAKKQKKMTQEYAGGDWTEIEMKRFISRESKLISIGMSAVHAESLAQTLLYRDRPDSGDDRKLCLECQNWNRGCKKPATGYCTIPTILQRCDGFMAKESA